MHARCKKQREKKSVRRREIEDEWDCLKCKREPLVQPIHRTSEYVLLISLFITMSGLDVATAAVGIGDVTFRILLETYKLLCEIQEAPKEIVQLRNELQTLADVLSSFRVVQKQSQWQTPALKAAKIQCEALCARLQDDLKKWTDGGDAKVIARLRFVRHKDDVEKYLKQIANAKTTVLLARTEDDRRNQNEQFQGIRDAIEDVRGRVDSGYFITGGQQQGK